MLSEEKPPKVKNSKPDKGSIPMIGAAIAIGGLGILAALALGIAAKVFYVEVDPLVMEIEEALPGANCGGCGQPGCSGAAAAIAAGKMPANGCVAGGAEVAVVIAGILGVEVKETEPEIAQVGCRYPIQRADTKFLYQGLQDCRAAFLMYDGPKECPIGCIGLGSCVKACPFDALSLGPDNLPVVDEAKCTGCGSCVRTCPAGIMKLTSVSNRILNEYSWDECTAPCQRRCPAGIDIPEQIRQTALGNYGEALKIIKERNPLPLICGRICPNPCELVCRRNLNDEPVAINHLKRFVSDYERNSGRRMFPYIAPPTNKKVAVIGGGVEGLSAAYFLARLGHSPKIFEAREKMGGLLRTVIPENRLPRDILDYEIDGILEMGVQAETNSAFGRDIYISKLFDDGYDVIQFSVGGWDALLNTSSAVEPAPALPQLFLLLPLSMAWASGRDINVSGSVAIVGCGKEVVNAARKCFKHGAEKVRILCPGPMKMMKLSEEEVEKLAEEGVEIELNSRVVELTGSGDNLKGMTYVVGLPAAVAAGNGRREDKRTVAVDAIIVAGGRLPDMIIQAESLTAEEKNGEPASSVPGTDRNWRTVMPYSTSRRSVDMFASRTSVSDHWAAVEAIGAGRRAASTVHKLLLNEEIVEPLYDLCKGEQLFLVDHLENLASVEPRHTMPETTPEERLDPAAEISLGFDEQTAKAEAARCLNCGLICYNRTQYN